MRGFSPPRKNGRRWGRFRMWCSWKVCCDKKNGICSTTEARISTLAWQKRPLCHRETAPPILDGGSLSYEEEDGFVDICGFGCLPFGPGWCRADDGSCCRCRGSSMVAARGVLRDLSSQLRRQ